MNKVTQLSIQSVLTKIALLLIAEVGGYYARKTGVQFSPQLTALLQHDLVPLVIPAVTLSITSWLDHHRINDASLKIDTALQLPPGTSNSQLNDVVQNAKTIAKESGQTPRDVITEATQGILK